LSKLIVSGMTNLEGSVSVGGSKNSTLPILAATLLANGCSTIYDVPYLLDIKIYDGYFALPRCRNNQCRRLGAFNMLQKPAGMFPIASIPPSCEHLFWLRGRCLHGARDLKFQCPEAAG
jgi:hypothetical protein